MEVAEGKSELHLTFLLMLHRLLLLIIGKMGTCPPASSSGWVRVFNNQLISSSPFPLGQPLRLFLP